jgi:hypothetical protein
MYIEDQIQLPRLTGTLRAFSNVTQKQHYDLDPIAEKQLIKKRKEALESADSKTCDWPSFLHKIVPTTTSAHVNAQNVKLKSLLDKLHSSISKKFLNEDFNDSSLLDEATLFLLEVFNQYKASNTSSSSYFQNTDKIVKKLKDKFGHFARNVFDSCKELMEQLFAELDQLDRLQLFDDFFAQNRIEIKENNSDNTFDTNDNDYFGSNIQFVPLFNETVSSKDDLNDISDESDSDDDETDETDDESFDLDKNESFKFNFPKETNDEQLLDSNNSTEISNKRLKVIEWTQTLSLEVCSIVYDLLSKKTSSNEAEIQNQLLELLGFERIELIEYLFMNSDEVVRSYKNYLQDDVNRKRNLIKMAQNQNKETKQPSNIGQTSSEMSVLTETERNIQKLIRKDEKKLKKLKMNQFEKEMGAKFDPLLLKQLRQDQLSEAHILQLYQQKKMNSMTKPAAQKHGVDQYPYVFDKMAKVLHNSAYINGAKVLLPDSVTKTETREYLEFNIQASENFDTLRQTVKPEKYIGTKEEICYAPLIKISELDDIGQIAFQNVKNLNRIQSIVYEKAYFSNQNLLICAPTGAGKTNIAMLTIINQIKMVIIYK